MTKFTLKLTLAMLSFATLLHFGYTAMTKAQLANSGKMMRNVCQPRFKVPDEKIENIKNGEFFEEPDVMCYINCVLQMSQMMKNGKMNYEAAAKQIDMMMPDPMKSALKQSMIDCKDIPDKYKDPCEASFHTAKCMQKACQENFFFP